MKKIMPLAASIALILIAGIFASAGSMAWFSDTETIGVHDISAGTLNLQVGANDPSTAHITIGDIAPGFEKVLIYEVRNTGTLDGKLSIQFSGITNNEFGRNEPEKLVDSTGGWLGYGELGEHLRLEVRNKPYIHTDDVFMFGFLNDLGGNTYDTRHYVSGPILLDSGEEWEIEFYFRLPIDTGNEVQSDSVEFDIIFHLDQVTP